MVKEMLINNGWQQKTVRIKLDYYRLCDFLYYNERKEDTEIRKMNDKIFNYSLDCLNKDIYSNFKILKIKALREPKGFLLKDETIEKLNSEYIKFKDYYKKRNINITIGEFTEFLLYIWCQDNLEEETLNFLDIHWCIEKIK